MRKTFEKKIPPYYFSARSRWRLGFFLSNTVHIRGGHLGGVRSYGGQECGGRSGGRPETYDPKRMLAKFSQHC